MQYLCRTDDRFRQSNQTPNIYNANLQSIKFLIYAQ
jgi:hypothetical protein